MKYYNNSKVSLLILSAILLALTSCSKKKEIIKVPPDATEQGADLLSIIESYYKFSTVKPDGKLMFESNLCNNDPQLTNIALVGGVFYDKQGNVETGGGPVSIGSYQLTANSKGTYGFDKMLPQKGLFGTKVTFTVNNKSNGNGQSGNSQNTATATLYSPQPISVTNVPPRTPINLVANTATAINWNTDPNNPNGVIIIGEYLPTRYMNKKSLSAGYSKMIESSIQVPDNGSTSIPWSFFSKFPQGGHIILWVARGNYTILANGRYSYQVGGYTAASVWDVRLPILPTAITGTLSYSGSVTSGGGSITGYPGTVITVKIGARLPGVGSTSTTPKTYLNISGATLSTGSTALTATPNTDKTATFIMPFSGSVNWNCLFDPTPSGGGIGYMSAY
jgi:hypothetical protein